MSFFVFFRNLLNKPVVLNIIFCFIIFFLTLSHLNNEARASCLPFYLYGYNGKFVHFPNDTNYCINSPDGEIKIATNKLGGRLIRSKSPTNSTLVFFGESQLFGYDISGDPGSHDLNKIFPNVNFVFYGAPNNGPFETINYMDYVLKHERISKAIVGFNYGTDIFRIMPKWDPNNFVPLKSNDLNFYLENPFLFEAKLTLDLITGGFFTSRRPDTQELQKLYSNLDQKLKIKQIKLFFKKLEDISKRHLFEIELIIYPPYWGFETTNSDILIENRNIMSSFNKFSCIFTNNINYINKVIIAQPINLTANLFTSDQRHYSRGNISFISKIEYCKQFNNS